MKPENKIKLYKWLSLAFGLWVFENYILPGTLSESEPISKKTNKKLWIYGYPLTIVILVGTLDMLLIQGQNYKAMIIINLLFIAELAYSEAKNYYEFR